MIDLESANGCAHGKGVAAVPQAHARGQGATHSQYPSRSPLLPTSAYEDGGSVVRYSLPVWQLSKHFLSVKFSYEVNYIEIETHCCVGALPASFAGPVLLPTQSFVLSLLGPAKVNTFKVFGCWNEKCDILSSCEKIQCTGLTSAAWITPEPNSLPALRYRVPCHFRSLLYLASGRDFQHIYRNLCSTVHLPAASTASVAFIAKGELCLLS